MLTYFSHLTLYLPYLPLTPCESRHHLSLFLVHRSYWYSRLWPLHSLPHPPPGLYMAGFSPLDLIPMPSKIFLPTCCENVPPSLPPACFLDPGDAKVTTHRPQFEWKVLRNFLSWIRRGESVRLVFPPMVATISRNDIGRSRCGFCGNSSVSLLSRKKRHPYTCAKCCARSLLWTVSLNP